MLPRFIVITIIITIITIIYIITLTDASEDEDEEPEEVKGAWEELIIIQREQQRWDCYHYDHNYDHYDHYHHHTKGALDVGLSFTQNLKQT